MLHKITSLYSVFFTLPDKTVLLRQYLYTSTYTNTYTITYSTYTTTSHLVLVFIKSYMKINLQQYLLLIYVGSPVLTVYLHRC